MRYVEVKVHCPNCGESGTTSVPFYIVPKDGEAIEQPHLTCPDRGTRVFEGTLRQADREQAGSG